MGCRWIYIIFIFLFANIVNANSTVNLVNLYEGAKYEKAFDFAIKRANSNDMIAQRIVGTLYIDAIEEKTNDNKLTETLTPLKNGSVLDKAKYWLLKASGQGDVESLVLLGEIYAIYAETSDNELAYHYFRKAHESGSAKGTYYLGLTYLNAIGVKQDIVKAFELFSDAAERGSKNSMRLIGNYYEYGYAGAKNINTAMKWYERAIEKGDHRSYRDMIRVIQYREYDLPDSKEEVEKLTEVADEIEVALCEKYFKGGLYSKAFNYCGYFAREGNLLAKYKYYVFWQASRVENPHYKKSALINLREAAEGGNSLAQIKFAEVLYKGLFGQIKNVDVAQSYAAKALSNLNKKAKNNDIESIHALGVMFYEGLGVAQDLNKGKFYNELAISKGFGPAKEYRENISASLK